jgi:hypothetical protein
MATPTFQSPITNGKARPWSGLHASTYVVLLSTALVLFLLNVPGQLVPYVGAPLEEEQLFGDHRIVRERLEHGWPFTYLIRDDRYFVNRPAESEPRPTAIWSFTEDLVSFEPWRLAGDLLAALGVIALVALLAEYWRRQRHSIWQLHMSDLLAITAIIAGTLWYLQTTLRDYNAENSAIQNLGLSVWDYSQYRSDPVSSPVSVRSHGGPTWLRSLLGERFPKVFDRLILLDDLSFTTSPDQIAAFKSLRALTVIRLPQQTPELGFLAQLKQLEAIQIVSAVSRPPQAKELDQEMAAALRPLADLPDLWFVDAVGDGFGDFTLKLLAAIPRLRVLKLSWSSMTDDGFAALAESQTLEQLHLSNIPLEGAALAQLQRLPRLRHLHLYMCTLSDAGLAELTQLFGLERLSINDTTAYTQELHRLAVLKNLKSLELSPHVDRDAVKELQLLMPTLKIEVGGQPFDAND